MIFFVTMFEAVFCWIQKVLEIFSSKKEEEDTIEILYRSKNFILINKKHDVLINSNDPNVTQSLHRKLSREFPSLINPKLKHNFHFVHRLDFATSGVICIALNKNAATAAALAFEKRCARKYYIALVRGYVAGELIDITASIGEQASEVDSSHRMCVEGDPGCLSPRFAHTRLLVLERGTFGRYPATKVLLRPITGRRHQLRVHCSNVGHTIVGDFTYSRKKDITPHRTYLHALRLVLPNSVESLDIHTPDPFQNTNNPEYAWEPFEVVNELENAYFKIDTPF